MTAALSCEGLWVEVASRTLVRDLSLDMQRGSVTAVLGCNGAGKTLTLHTLAGLRAPARGEVRLSGKPMVTLTRREISLQLGLLPQLTEDPFPSTVFETVLVGRHPHVGFWEWESERDRDIAREAMRTLQLEAFTERQVATLSGGERRRVAVATLLAQDPEIYLLDEPVNHLDPHHQLDVLRLMRERAAEGRTVVMSLHDAGLAARFCDRALLLFGNGDWLSGSTEEVLTEASISRLYGISAREIRWPSGRVFVAE